MQVSRTHIEGRAVTREPDVTKEVRRGNMKERWGMEVVYRATDSVSLELAVTKVRLRSLEAPVTSCCLPRCVSPARRTRRD